MSPPLKFGPPRRVEILSSRGKYFKPGQYAYVISTIDKPGMFYQDVDRESRAGETSYLVSKTKEMRGEALWYSASGLRFTSRTKPKRTASLRRVAKRSKPKRKRARRKTARTRLRKRISRRRVMSLPRGTRWEVVESKRWVNTKNGRTASPYGSIPWTSDTEKHDWQLQNVGWTVRDNNTGTVGVGRQPWASKQEAQEAANKFNNR